MQPSPIPRPNTNMKIVNFPIFPLCPKCKQPVPNVVRTDERGKAMHEECYWLDLHANPDVAPRDRTNL